MKHTIAIVGAGFGGLAAGLRLSQQGHQVMIFDPNEQPGGKASGIQIEGMWFDSGPSVLRMPHLFYDLLDKLPAELKSQCRLMPIDPLFQFTNQSTRQSFSIYENPAQTVEQLNSISPSSAQQYLAFLQFSRSLYKENLDLAPSDHPNFLQSTLKTISNTRQHASPMPQSIYQRAQEFFEDPFVQASVASFPLFFGQNPLSMPGRHLMLHAIEQQWGIVYPQGGLRQLALILVAGIRSLGGKVHGGTGVEQIVLRKNLAIGVRTTEGRFIPADYVISNLSPYHTRAQLISPSGTQSTTPAGQFGSSYAILHFVCERLPFREQMHHHTYLIPAHFRQSMVSIFQHREIPKELWVYLNVPTLIDTSLTTASIDLVMAVVPLPNLSAAISWHSESRKFIKKVIDTVEATFPGFRRSILHEKITTPLELASDNNLLYGSNAVPNMPVNNITRLHFVGENTWRGLGFIASLSSAEEVCSAIENDPL